MKSDDGKLLSEQMLEYRGKINESNSYKENLKKGIKDSIKFISENRSLDKEKENLESLYKVNQDHIQNLIVSSSKHQETINFLNRQVLVLNELTNQHKEASKISKFLNDLIKNYKELFNKDASDLEDAFFKMSLITDFTSKKAEEAHQNLRNLQSDFKKLKKAKKLKIKKIIVSRLCFVMRMGTENFFRRWKWETVLSKEDGEEKTSELEGESQRIMKLYNLNL